MKNSFRLLTRAALLTLFATSLVSLSAQSSGSDFLYPSRGPQHYISVSHVGFPAEESVRAGFSGIVNCHVTYGLHTAGVVRALVGFGFYQFNYAQGLLQEVRHIGARPQAMLLLQPRIGRRANLQFAAGYSYYVKLSGGHDFDNNLGMYTARAGFQLAALNLAASYQTSALGKSGSEPVGMTGKIVELSVGCAF